MVIVYAREPYAPGEQPIYQFHFVPGNGKGLAAGDSVTGSPSATVERISDGVDVTADRVGPPASTAKLGPNPVTLVGGVDIYLQLQNAVDGESYRVKILYDTANGERNMQIDFFINGKEY